MKKYRTFYLYCGIIMLISELWKQWCLTYIVNQGIYNWWYFPFQLCSIPMYICLILPWIQSNRTYRTLQTFLMDYSLLGGIFVFFDTSGMHYEYPPLTVHSFAWHILLIIIGLITGLSKKADYTLKGYRRCTLIYLSGCAIATILNLAIDPYGSINMFYISPHYVMTQKVFGDIAQILGNVTGIIIYIAATILGAGIIHIVWKTQSGTG